MCPYARTLRVVTVRGMSYPSDLTDDQWDLLEPVSNAAGKRGRKPAEDLRAVVDAMLHIAQTGRQWRYLPQSLGRGRGSGRVPSLVVIDTHLARGASNGGLTFHDRGGPFGRTKGAKRVVAVDVTGLPVAALAVSALHPREPGQRASWSTIQGTRVPW